MDFVSFELAKKLKEKGFEIPTRSIVAMYNEQGVFFTLTTAADYQVSPSGYKCRCYYDYDDFDEHDFIAPTISQVLKWLREEKKIHIKPVLWSMGWYVDIRSFTKETDEDGVAYEDKFEFQSIDYETYEEAVIAGANYCLENLI